MIVVRQLPAGTHGYCHFFSFEGTENIADLVSTAEIAVIDILNSTMKSRFPVFLVVGKTEITILDIPQVKMVVEGQLIAHSRIQRGRIGVRECCIVVAHSNQGASQRGRPGGCGEIEKLIRIVTAYLRL
jgi:hypothetical protein